MTPKAQHKTEPRYCGGCKITTPHSVRADSHKCNRCGSIKHPTKQHVKVEDRIAEALGIFEDADTPKLYKPEGEAKTSAEGAHRPDKGTKFTQLRYDDQFKHKADYFTLHH